MERLYQLAKGLNARYPSGDEPFQIVSRLLEECGEVASEVNHLENTGIKQAKHGEPDKRKLAGEIRQSLTALLQLAMVYSIEEELEQSIKTALDKMKGEGWIA